MKKIIFYFSLLLLYFINIAINKADSRDFIFMIDNSGSMRMRSHDVNRRIPDSIIKFTNIINEKYPNEDRVAIIKFDKRAETLMPLLSTEEIINDKKLEKAFSNMDYRGKYTVINTALNTAFNVIDNYTNVIYLIIISDGDLSQSNDPLKNDLLILDDAIKVEKIIKTKINRYNNINLALIPFSKRVTYKYFKTFNSVTSEKDSLMEKVVKGEDLYYRLKSHFVYLCADFPKESVEFKMAFLIANEDGIASNVFDILMHDLPSTYEFVKLRKVNVIRIIKQGLKWSWDETKDIKIQKELLRKNKVNAICIVSANNDNSLKFRIIGCSSYSREEYCTTNKTKDVNALQDVAIQFKNKYLKLEKEIIDEILSN